MPQYLYSCLKSDSGVNPLLRFSRPPNRCGWRNLLSSSEDVLSQIRQYTSGDRHNESDEKMFREKGGVKAGQFITSVPGVSLVVYDVWKIPD